MMTTHELIEYAALDALGLLEPHERDAFEAAFAKAPPHVQAHVRREQKRFAVSSEAMLPDVDAPAGLRFKVLAAVRDAMKKASPLHVNRERQRQGQPLLLQFWSSAAMWRVAAVALATASVTLGVVTFNMYNAQQSANASVNGRTGADVHHALVLKHGRAVAAVLEAPKVTVRNLAADPNREAPLLCAANVYFDPDTGRAALLCRDLPVVNASYKVVVLDDEGKVLRDLGVAFNATPSSQSLMLPEGLAVADLGAIAIVGPTQNGGPDEIIVASRFA